jgi:hypothetical protein
MEHIFPPQTVALGANVQSTIVWNSADIARLFPESIIRKPVSLRFSCITTSANAVNCGVRYSTLTKEYLLAERKTLFIIPPNTSTEITPASKPALGLLEPDITSFSLDLVTPTGGGSATVILVVNDEPPPLSSEAGELIGLDARFSEDYILIRVGDSRAVNGGATQSFTLYTVPAGKRFYLDYFYVIVPATPSFPDTCYVQVNMSISGGTISIPTFSRVDRSNALFVLQNFTLPFGAGDFINVSDVNTDTTIATFVCALVGREVY